MNDDLESFLKKAAQQRRARQQQPAPDMIIEAEVVEEGLIELVDDDIVPVESVTEHVSSHVQEHIAPSAHAERLSHMGERVGLADEKLESHLHDVFDHRVGQLGTTSVTDKLYEKADADPYAESPVERAGAEGDTSFATELVAMMQNPKSLRQAIVLSEILTRPEFRW